LETIIYLIVVILISVVVSLLDSFAKFIGIVPLQIIIILVSFVIYVIFFATQMWGLTGKTGIICWKKYIVGFITDPDRREEWALCIPGILLIIIALGLYYLIYGVYFGHIHPWEAFDKITGSSRLERKGQAWVILLALAPGVIPLGVGIYGLALLAPVIFLLVFSLLLVLPTMILSLFYLMGHGWGILYCQILRIFGMDVDLKYDAEGIGVAILFTSLIILPLCIYYFKYHYQQSILISITPAILIFLFLPLLNIVIGKIYEKIINK
jgi:hypothetical protein